MVARLSLSYGPSLCLSSALSHRLCAVRAACNKSSFVRSNKVVDLWLVVVKSGRESD